MRIISVSRLSPGMRLARTIYSQDGGRRRPLLAEGVVIAPAMIAALARARVGAVYVDDAASEGITPSSILPPDVREGAVREVAAVLAEVAARGPSTRVDGARIERMKDVVAGVLAAIRESGGLASSLADLGGHDRYTLEHSVNVMTLGLAVGEAAHRRLGWTDWTGRTRHDALDERLVKLGVGLLLHDIGKMVVPPEILNKPGRLTDDEMAIMREHPIAGVQLIDADALSPITRAVIVGHHERWDGSGYPYGRSGAEIHPHALVAGIVDVYDAVSSTRVYRAGRPAHVAWEMLVAMADRGFPRDLIRVFADVVVPYPEGTCVLLSDGTRALVVSNSPGCGSRPRVRVVADAAGAPLSPWEGDLAGVPELSIVRALPDIAADAGVPAPADAVGAETGDGR